MGNNKLFLEKCDGKCFNFFTVLVSSSWTSSFKQDSDWARDSPVWLCKCAGRLTASMALASLSKAHLRDSYGPPISGRTLMSSKACATCCGAAAFAGLVCEKTWMAIMALSN